MDGQGSDNSGNADHVKAEGLTPKDQLQLAQQLELHHLQPELLAEFTDISDGPGIKLDCAIKTLQAPITAEFVRNDAVESLALNPQFFNVDMLDTTCDFADNLELARSGRITRSRVDEQDLSEGRRQILNRALDKKYSSLPAPPQVSGIYKDIPPEAVGSIQLEPDLSAASFVPDSTDDNSEMRSGFHLIVVTTTQNKTEKFLIRLD